MFHGNEFFLPTSPLILQTFSRSQRAFTPDGNPAPWPSRAPALGPQLHSTSRTARHIAATSRAAAAFAPAAAAFAAQPWTEAVTARERCPPPWAPGSSSSDPATSFAASAVSLAAAFLLPVRLRLHGWWRRRRGTSSCHVDGGSRTRSSYARPSPPPRSSSPSSPRPRGD